MLMANHTSRTASSSKPLYSELLTVSNTLFVRSPANVACFFHKPLAIAVATLVIFATLSHLLPTAFSYFFPSTLVAFKMLKPMPPIIFAVNSSFFAVDLKKGHSIHCLFRSCPRQIDFIQSLQILACCSKIIIVAFQGLALLNHANFFVWQKLRLILPCSIHFAVKVFP
jgi:hypothetical protein